MKKKQPKGLKALKARAAYLARFLYARQADMDKLKERQTLRNEHLQGHDMLHRKNKRERIRVLPDDNMTSGLRAALIENRAVTCRRNQGTRNTSA